MNIYDNAHEMARALSNSDEYRTFLSAKRVVDTDQVAKKMVQDFFAKQMELEYQKMSGAKEDSAKVEQLHKMAELMRFNQKASDFWQAYMRFQTIMADVYKILGESVAEGMDVFAKK